MKKIIPVLLIALLISTPAMAGTSFGVTGGLNLSKFSGEDINEDMNDMKMGIALGGYANIGITPMFSIQPELLYSMKGSKYTMETATDTTERTTKMNYIEMPILFKVTPPMAGMMSPELFLGPYFGYNITAESEVNGTTSDIDSVKAFDYGLVAGAGVGFSAGPGTINLNGRYEMGLSSIDDSSAEADWKNTNIAIRLSYSFPF